MEKANEIITANQLQYTPQLDDKGHTLEQYSYDHFRFVYLNFYLNRINKEKQRIYLIFFLKTKYL